VIDVRNSVSEICKSYCLKLGEPRWRLEYPHHVGQTAGAALASLAAV